MDIEPRDIVERFIATWPAAFKVLDADLDAGVMTFNFNGLDNTVYLPAEALAATVTETRSPDAQLRQEVLDGPQLIDAVVDGMSFAFDESFSSTPNPARVWTYYDGYFEPVTPDGLADYLAVPPLTALTLSGEGLVGMTSAGPREILLEELDVGADLTHRLRQWLSDAEKLSNIARSDRQAAWSVLTTQGVSLADQLQNALGPDVVIGYVNREPLHEARPSDSADELGPTNDPDGFWTTDYLNDPLEES